MNYDERLKMLGLDHLKGMPRAILKATNKMMVHEPYRLAQAVKAQDQDRPRGRFLSSVVGIDERGRLVVKPYTPPKPRAVGEHLLVILQAAVAQMHEGKYDCAEAEGSDCAGQGVRKANNSACCSGEQLRLPFD